MSSSSVYDFSAFHLLLGEAAWELQRNTQAPDVMIGMAVTAVAAAVVQGLADVRLPSGHTRPTALNFLVIAESGERKTTVDNLAFGPVYERDAAKVLAYRQAYEAYQAELHLWKVKERSLNKSLKKAEGEEEVHWRDVLEQHLRAMPKKPRLRRLMRQNITDRALMDALEGDGESIILSADEGEILLKSRTMTQLGRLNKAYDGAPLLSLDLADDEHVVVANPRLSINLMTQRAVLQEYLGKRGEVMRGSGHLARYLVACPVSTQGYRWVSDNEPAWEMLPKLHARVKELLDRYDKRVEAGDLSREVLTFSDEAKVRWIDLARQTEGMLRPGQYLSDINDFASKAMEMLGRLAAVFHYFNGEEGKISVDTLERAFTFLRWHLDEFKRLFSGDLVPPEDLVDAQKIEEYLRFRAPLLMHNGEKYVKKNLLLHHRVVPSARRLNAALEVLIARQAIRIEQDPKTKQKFVVLNAYYFN